MVGQGRGDSRVGERRRRGLVRSLGVVAAVLAVAGCSGGGDDGSGVPERSAQQVLDDFVAARGSGDCSRIIDLATPRSWSLNGALGRDEFLERCEDAVGDNGPAGDPSAPTLRLNAVPPREPAEGDRLTVGGRSLRYPSSGPEPEGQMVFEGGRWLVELDMQVLRLGRSVDEVFDAYLRAYNDGDCEAMAETLASDDWFPDGDPSKEEFLDRCADEAAARVEAEQPPIEVAFIEATSLSAEAATLDLGLGRAGDGLRITSRMEPLELVRDGFEWTIVGAPPAEGRGNVALWSLRIVELESMLVDELSVNGQTCRLGVAHTAEGRNRTDDGVTATYSCDSTGDFELSLFPFDDADAARTAAQRIAQQAGAPLGCAEGCPDLHTVVAHGEYVIEVNLTIGSDADVTTVVDAQIERLPNRGG